MKKQINPTIKAHLIRGVFYLLLLLAVCAIPFALAQRDTNKRSAAGVCGLLVGSGMTLGYAPDGWKPTLAGNTVHYTFGNSQAAPNDFALFETHDPWGFTVLKDAITGAGHTYTEFTPAQLAGFDFSQYRVVVLNWDDTFLNDFLADYSAAIPALEAYINAGGIVWVQAAIQGNQGDNHPMPFGGKVNGADFVNNDPVVDPASPMMVGMPNPIPGNSASHVSYSGLSGAAHIVVINGNNAQATLYNYRPCQGGTPTPTVLPTCTPIVEVGRLDTGDPTHFHRLQISGIAQTCPTSTSCAIRLSGTHHYDSYTFENTSGGTQCVTIDTRTPCNGYDSIFTAAYLGSFDPHSLCTNWIGDSGSIPNPDQAFQVNVDNGQTLVIVVSEVYPFNFGCRSYTVTITGLCGGGKPSPTPTPTATPTATGTAIATPTTTPPTTPTATPTAIPSATPRVTPRSRPTPHPRPTP
jgi:hypothetical protein